MFSTSVWCKATSQKTHCSHKNILWNEPKHTQRSSHQFWVEMVTICQLTFPRSRMNYDPQLPLCWKVFLHLKKINDSILKKKNPLRVAEKHVLPKRKTRLLFWAHEKSTFISVFSWQLSSTVINARLFRLNIPSSLRSVNTSCMYPCGITYLSIHSPFPFSSFVLAANRVASIQRFLLLHENVRDIPFRGITIYSPPCHTG